MKLNFYFYSLELLCLTYMEQHDKELYLRRGDEVNKLWPTLRWKLYLSAIQVAKGFSNSLSFYSVKPEETKQ